MLRLAVRIGFRRSGSSSRRDGAAAKHLADVYPPAAVVIGLRSVGSRRRDGAAVLGHATLGCTVALKNNKSFQVVQVAE